MTDQPVFAVAGFWQATDEGNSFAMVACKPKSLVAPIHPKPMVTILKPDDFDTWLRGSYQQIIALQQQYQASKMPVRGPTFPTRGQ